MQHIDSSIGHASLSRPNGSSPSLLSGKMTSVTSAHIVAPVAVNGSGNGASSRQKAGSLPPVSGGRLPPNGTPSTAPLTIVGAFVHPSLPQGSRPSTPLVPSQNNGRSSLEQVGLASAIRMGSAQMNNTSSSSGGHNASTSLSLHQSANHSISNGPNTPQKYRGSFGGSSSPSLSTENVPVLPKIQPVGFGRLPASVEHATIPIGTASHSNNNNSMPVSSTTRPPTGGHRASSAAGPLSYSTETLPGGSSSYHHGDNSSPASRRMANLSTSSGGRGRRSSTPTIADHSSTATPSEGPHQALQPLYLPTRLGSPPLGPPPPMLSFPPQENLELGTSNRPHPPLTPHVQSGSTAVATVSSAVTSPSYINIASVNSINTVGTISVTSIMSSSLQAPHSGGRGHTHPIIRASAHHSLVSSVGKGPRIGSTPPSHNVKGSSYSMTGELPMASTPTTVVTQPMALSGFAAISTSPSAPPLMGSHTSRRGSGSGQAMLGGSLCGGSGRSSGSKALAAISNYFEGKQKNSPRLHLSDTKSSGNGAFSGSLRSSPSAREQPVVTGIVAQLSAVQLGLKAPSVTSPTAANPPTCLPFHNINKSNSPSPMQPIPSPPPAAQPTGKGFSRPLSPSDWAGIRVENIPLPSAFPSQLTVNQLVGDLRLAGSTSGVSEGGTSVLLPMSGPVCAPPAATEVNTMSGSANNPLIGFVGGKPFVVAVPVSQTDRSLLGDTSSSSKQEKSINLSLKSATGAPARDEEEGEAATDPFILASVSPSDDEVDASLPPGSHIGPMTVPLTAAASLNSWLNPGAFIAPEGAAPIEGCSPQDPNILSDCGEGCIGADEVEERKASIPSLLPWAAEEDDEIEDMERGFRFARNKVGVSYPEEAKKRRPLRTTGQVKFFANAMVVTEAADEEQVVNAIAAIIGDVVGLESPLSAPLGDAITPTAAFGEGQSMPIQLKSPPPQLSLMSSSSTQKPSPLSTDSTDPAATAGNRGRDVISPIEALDRAVAATVNVIVRSSSGAAYLGPDAEASLENNLSVSSECSESLTATATSHPNGGDEDNPPWAQRRAPNDSRADEEVDADDEDRLPVSINELHAMAVEAGGLVGDGVRAGSGSAPEGEAESARSSEDSSNANQQYASPPPSVGVMNALNVFGHNGGGGNVSSSQASTPSIASHTTGGSSSTVSASPLTRYRNAPITSVFLPSRLHRGSNGGTSSASSNGNLTPRGPTVVTASSIQMGSPAPDSTGGELESSPNVATVSPRSIIIRSPAIQSHDSLMGPPTPQQPSPPSSVPTPSRYRRYIVGASGSSSIGLVAAHPPSSVEVSPSHSTASIAARPHLLLHRVNAVPVPALQMPMQPNSMNTNGASSGHTTSSSEGDKSGVSMLRSPVGSPRYMRKSSPSLTATATDWDVADVTPRAEDRTPMASAPSDAHRRSSALEIDSPVSVGPLAPPPAPPSVAHLVLNSRRTHSTPPPTSRAHSNTSRAPRPTVFRCVPLVAEKETQQRQRARRVLQARTSTYDEIGALIGSAALPSSLNMPGPHPPSPQTSTKVPPPGMDRDGTTPSPSPTPKAMSAIAAEARKLWKETNGSSGSAERSLQSVEVGGISPKHVHHSEDAFGGDEDDGFLAEVVGEDAWD